MLRKLAVLAVAVFVTGCSTAPPVEQPVPVPGGYYQFCEDNPTSPLCKQE